MKLIWKKQGEKEELVDEVGGGKKKGRRKRENGA